MEAISKEIPGLQPDIARLNTVLSKEDTFRLIKMEAIYKTRRGDALLAFSDDLCTFSLVKRYGGGYIPRDAMLPCPYSSLLENIGLFRVVVRDKFGYQEANDYVEELSEKLSKYIWPSADQDEVIHVQFRSHVACSYPCQFQLKVEFGDSDDNGKFCLVPCNDGTVRFLLRSKCKLREHIWTVQLFDLSSSNEKVHANQRLRRKAVADNKSPVIVRAESSDPPGSPYFVQIFNAENMVYVVNHTKQGENSNKSGQQSIGSVTSQTAINLPMEEKGRKK